jgi:peptide-methionine (S)-S-oxide reductase
MEHSQELESIILGGGCFWCLEAVYDQLNGVVDVVSGYSGGSIPEPNYQQVCTGKTGHAEVVQVTFDTGAISLREILEVFFSIHDPTTLNRQGADVGPQYRSVIFFRDEQQKSIASDLMREINDSHNWSSPIVTQLVPVQAFYPAEDYHQNYFEKNPYQGYCRAMIAPKISKFQHTFEGKLKG